MSAKKSLTIDYSQDCPQEQTTLKKALSKLPLLTSKHTDWQGVYLAYDYLDRAGETYEIISRQHNLIIFTETPEIVTAQRRIGEEISEEKIRAGDVVVVPANTPHQVQWDKQGSWVMLGFDPSICDRALYETVDPDKLEIIPNFAKPDPLIHQLALKLKTEVESGGLGSRLYADAIANLISIHLFQNYSATKPLIGNYSDGLPTYKLKRIIAYIDANLERSISLEELAGIAQMSAGYFSRLFKKSTGFAPHQYLIRCRVKRAKELLRQRRLTIAEVAYEVGFANQGHLNYHFKKIVGITPKVMQMGG